MDHPIVEAATSLEGPPLAKPLAVPLAVFPHPDGSRVPYKVFSSQEIYDREQERIYRGPT